MKSMVFTLCEDTSLTDSILKEVGIEHEKAKKIAGGNPGAATILIKMHGRMTSDEFERQLDNSLAFKHVGSEFYVHHKSELSR